MSDRTPENGLIVLLLLVLIGGSFFVWTHAPCGLWEFSKAGHMPSRCIAEVINHK